MSNDKKNGTTFQKLNNFFNLPNFSKPTTEKTIDNKSKIIIRGNSPEEINRKALELEQQKKLRDKFYRTTDRGFQKSLQYEAARLPAYIDYEGMEHSPLISSALDLFMEEATTIGTNGKMLNIHSNKERIRLLLEEFFYDVININVNLPFWTRNLVKYGDNFVLMYGEKNKGITHIKQMVNYEIERLERIQNGRPITRFKERMTGDEFNTFEIAHFRLLGDDKFLPYGSSILNKIRRVFRQLILAEDAMLTYRILRAGEKKVFKIDVGNIDEEDIEEYIYKVATKFKRTTEINPNDGQIDHRFNILGNDEDYFLPVRNANTQTGIETLEGACLALDTKIDLLDGRSLQLKDIICEYESGKELWSYSIDPSTGKIVPGKITWAGVTRKNTDVLKITLDNGENIICTPDHKFPTKYNGTIEAKDLTIGESMWSFNKKFEKIKKCTNEYELIYDHSINDWIFSHRMVDNYFNGDIERGYVRHHKDFSRYNNNPNNIERLTINDHFRLHGEMSTIGSDAFKEKYNTDRKFKNEVDNILKDARKKYHDKLKKDIGFKTKVSKKHSNNRKKYFKNLSDEELNKIIKSLRTPEAIEKAINTFNNNPNKEKIINERTRKSIITKNKVENKLKYSENTKKLWKNEKFSKSVIEKQKYKYSNKLLDLLIQYYTECNNLNNILNEKINKENSEWLIEFNKLNDKNKQYKKLTRITNNNIDKMLKHFNYKNWRDFKTKIPVYNHKIVSVEWLSEKQDTGTITIDGNEEFHNFHNFALTCGIFTKNSNLDKIQDIEYLRDNLFMGLGVPKPFLSFQDAAGGGKNLAQFDIRFSKKVNRIQQAVIQELNKMAMIHLYLMGYDNVDDIKNFKLTLSNPSTQSELVQAELLREKAQTYTELTRAENGIAAMSHTKAKRLVFNMSDSEIVLDLKEQKMEKVVEQELADAPVIIKQSGLFKDIDKLYGDDNPNIPQTPNQETGQEGPQPQGGEIEGGEEGAEGLPNQSPTDLPPVQPESVAPKKIMEMGKYLNHVNDLVYGENKKYDAIKKQKEIIKENDEKNDDLNSKAITMSDEISKMLNETEKININYDLDDDDNIEDFIDFDINDIEDEE